MRFIGTCRTALGLFVGLVLALGPVQLVAAPVSNTASGAIDGVPSNATVTLDRVGGVASLVLAEIAPNEVPTSSTANRFTYHLLPTIGPGDSGIERVEITAPAGYANLAVPSVAVGGVNLASSCPTPGSGQFCATVAGAVLTVVLGDKVVATQTEIRIDCDADAPNVPGSADFTSVVADGLISQATFPGDADQDPSDANSITVEVLQTQGLVLQLVKSANKQDVLVGEVVTYSVVIRNTADFDVLQVTLQDTIPANFKYLSGSARLDGAPIPDPTGNRTLVFDIGTVPAFLDGNGNGTADPGEPGYLVLTYQLVVGSGATPGRYPNTVVGKDFCEICVISNVAGAAVDVTIDPLFDLGLIIGKVFEDRNRNEWQDPGERGVPGAMVALDDGTYALTDEHGRFHFPAAKPGQRMLKLNLLTLPGASAATDASRVVWITPGLMVRVNFGVVLERNVESIGRPAEPGLRVIGDSIELPVELEGDPQTMSLLVNGDRFALPAGGVRLGLDPLEETVHLSGDPSDLPLTFRLVDLPASRARSWKLTILGGTGEPFRTIGGQGQPPETVPWDGTADDGRLVEAGKVYRYRLEVSYEDGSESKSPLRPFGVNRIKGLTLNCIAKAFEFDSAELTPAAIRALAQAAQALRQVPDEPVAIEGHTDSIGTVAYNLRLSEKRAAAVLEYLVEEEQLHAGRFALHGYGESRPTATNETAEGRATNRRVEIRAEMEEIVRSELEPEPPAVPSVRISGDPIPRSKDGRYASRWNAIEKDALRTLEIEVSNSEGRSGRATITIPRIEITSPSGTVLLAHQASANGCTNDGTAEAGASPTLVTCRIAGHTDPGSSVELDGEPLDVELDGSFVTRRSMLAGRNTLRFLARNPQGITHLARLDVDVSDRHADGRRVTVGQPVPHLAVNLPPAGVPLTSSRLALVGATDVANTVRVNDRSVEVGLDGRFHANVELPAGKSRLTIQVTDPEGHVGTIEREVEVPKHELFLMVFADGKISKLEADGFVEGAGLEGDDDYFVDGRLAFYLKGRIAGKYLITSALDTGKDEMEYLFRNVDFDQTQLLLRNLDPDRFYPIYGDSSTVVFDAQSRGRFYLALDSETVHAVVGNYPLAITDTELAAYQRTLYGARFAYHSATRTKYGEPDTQVVVFGAEVEQAHMRDELRATGGSLYYLSQRDVIEGSEQVTLVVRDEITGLVLSRRTQQQNVDYTIKYEEGRLMFHRPISSVAPNDTLVGGNVLTGNPVFLQVDYEARLDAFEKSAAGGRVRQQIGDHVAVGGTYIEDELQGGPYELKGVDAEIRLGQGTRLIAEYAESSGNDSLTFLSDDGGLTYTVAPTAAGMRGSAWKAAAELDVGEWFGSPDRYRVGAYYKKLDSGFISSGNLLEQGSERSGVHGRISATGKDTILFRYDRDDRTLPAAAPAGAPDTTTVGSVEWKHKQNTWGFDVEYLDKDSEDVSGNPVQSSSLGGVRLWKKFGEKLHLRLERQQTLSGESNDRTRVGADYQVHPSVALTLEATDGTLGQSAQAGAIVTVGDSEIYLTERLAQDQAGQKSSTVLGARSPLGKSGKVYTEYQEEDAESGTRVVSLVGLQRQWDLAPGFRFVLSGEAADVNSVAGNSERRTVATSLSYVDPGRLSVVTRNEARFEEGATDRTQFFSFSQFDYTLNSDLSLLARYRYSKTEDSNTNLSEAKLDERVVGLAFRPVAHDRFNSIAKYTRLFDMRPLALGGAEDLRRTMDVVSVETAYQISRRLEWLGKGAFRRQQESTAGMPDVETSTYLTIQHFNITLYDPIDLGVEYRILGQREADDRQQGWLGELTWRVKKHFRFGIGYNFTDFSDDEFSQNDYTVRGWFIRAQGKY